MLIVAGHFELDPADRDAFLEGRSEAMRETRKEPGNLEYVMSADPVDATRVILLERWADQDAFDQHMKVIASAPRGTGPAPKGMSIKIYDVSGERSLG
jgi:quinol monooxygenase YgiN